jgi:hypothetical protein
MKKENLGWQNRESGEFGHLCRFAFAAMILFEKTKPILDKAKVKSKKEK